MPNAVSPVSLPPGWFPGSDGHAANPGGIPFYTPPFWATLPLIPSGLAGQQLFYSSTAIQTTVVQDLGSVLQVASVQGYPVQYPFSLLLEWGTSNQEVATVTQAPSYNPGTGIYQYGSVLRGQDGTTQVFHAPGAQVNHGVSARDFFQVAPVFNVCAYGADPTGTIDSAPAYQAAVNACISAGGGIVQFPAGNFKQLSTVTCAIPTGNNNSNGFGTPVYIRGAGRWATQISYYGTGDCLRVYSPGYPYGGGFTGLTIDGTNAQPGAAGLHMGDIFQYEVDFAVQNFTGTGSKGTWFDNQYFFTEQLHGRVFASNCTQLVVFDNSANASGSATSSFDRARLDLFVFDHGGQDCVVFKNGASIADGDLGVYGNCNKTTPANTAAVLRLGFGSQLQNCRLYAGVELDGSGNAPQTINFGTTVSGSGVISCMGLLDFSVAGTFAASNIATQGTFKFYGEVLGDSTLQGQSLSQGAVTTSSVKTETSGSYSISAATDYVILGDTTAGNVTLTLPDATTCKGQQFVVICIQDNNNVVLNTTSAQTVASLASGAWIANTTGTGFAVISDGANWQVISCIGVMDSFNILSGGIGFIYQANIYAGGLNLEASSGTNSSAAATVTSPSFTTATAAQVNTSFDVMLYIAVQTAAALAVAIGPANTTTTALMPSKTYALGLITIRVPAGWWVKITGTIADLSITAVTC